LQYSNDITTNSTETNIQRSLHVAGLRSGGDSDNESNADSLALSDGDGVNMGGNEWDRGTRSSSMCGSPPPGDADISGGSDIARFRRSSSQNLNVSNESRRNRQRSGSRNSSGSNSRAEGTPRRVSFADETDFAVIAAGFEDNGKNTRFETKEDNTINNINTSKDTDKNNSHKDQMDTKMSANHSILQEDHSSDKTDFRGKRKMHYAGAGLSMKELLRRSRELDAEEEEI
jgi:hypothetical protein